MNISIPKIKNMNIDLNTVLDSIKGLVPASPVLLVDLTTIEKVGALFFSFLTMAVITYYRGKKSKLEIGQSKEAHEKDMRIKDLQIQGLENKLTKTSIN